MNAVAQMPGTAEGQDVRVWTPYVRIFHWSLVAAMATAWLSAGETRSLHEYAGYVAGGLVATRLAAGLAGGRYTRFGQFVRSPAAVLRYIEDMARNRETRHLGHNPAGAAMVLALIATVAAIALTGWMQTTDAFWGVGWVEEMHETLGNLVIVLVGLHVAGVATASIRHRENLVRAMLTGRKRAPGPGDVA